MARDYETIDKKHFFGKMTEEDHKNLEKLLVKDPKIGNYILSYKRPECITAKTFESFGFKDFIIVIGNDDNFRQQYEERWGKDRVVVFPKDEYVKMVKYVGNTPIKATGAVPVRNFMRDLSVSRGETHHAQWDDDYVSLEFLGISLSKENIDRGVNFIELLNFVQNLMKRFVETTGVPYISGSLPNSPIGGDRCASYGPFYSSVVKKGFNTFLFSNAHFQNWFYKTADDVCQSLMSWNLGIPIWGMKWFIRPGLESEAADIKGKTGNSEIYKTDKSWFKAFTPTMFKPLMNKATLRYLREGDQYMFAHRVEVSDACPKILEAKYGIKGKKLDKDVYFKRYKTFVPK